MSAALLSMQGQIAPDFIKKYLYLRSENEITSYRFGTT